MTPEEARAILSSPEQRAKDERRGQLIDRQVGPPPWNHLAPQCLPPLDEEEARELDQLRLEYFRLVAAAWPLEQFRERVT